MNAGNVVLQETERPAVSIGGRQARRDARRFYVGLSTACLAIAVNWLHAHLLAAVGSRYVRRPAARPSPRRAVLGVAAVLPGPDTARRAGPGRTSSRVGPARRLTRNRHGDCRYRRRERRAGDTTRRRLRRSRARVSHRLDVDDGALRSVRRHRARMRVSTGDTQAADGSRDHLYPPSRDGAAVLCRERRHRAWACARAGALPGRWRACSCPRWWPTCSSWPPSSTTCVRAAVRMPVYVVGGAIVLAVQLLRGPLSTTQWWYALADSLARLAG